MLNARKESVPVLNSNTLPLMTKSPSDILFKRTKLLQFFQVLEEDLLNCSTCNFVNGQPHQK